MARCGRQLFFPIFDRKNYLSRDAAGIVEMALK